MSQHRKLTIFFSFFFRRKTLLVSGAWVQQSLFQLQRPVQARAHPPRKEAVRLQDARMQQTLYRPKLIAQTRAHAWSLLPARESPRRLP